MKKKVAMLQPNYIPWKGVFDLISRVDTFVFYDDVQYTRRDWRNRNKIKTKNGELWLTVPVINKRGQLICDAAIDNSTPWQEKHYKSIRSNYARADYFLDYEYILDEIFINRKWEKISDLNIFSTQLISKALDIKTKWVRSSDLRMTGDKDGEKVIKICKELQCNHFINGPASKKFMNKEKFIAEGIYLEFINYTYKEYPQLHPPFSHQVSVLDVIFNCGKNAKEFICNKEYSQ